MDKKISSLEYNNRTVYGCFNNPFIADCGSPDFCLTPITIDDIPRLHKRSRYTLDMLPAAISVSSENYCSNLITPSDSPDLLPNDDPNNLHVLKKDVPFKGRFHRGYCCMKHGRKRCYKNTRFYCSTCSDEEKKFYYCHGFSKISLATRTCFLKHQNSM